MNSMISVVCFKCQKLISGLSLIGRKDDCPNCRSDLHVCKNCEFYDPKVYNECKEPQAETIKDRERSNFCDFFKPYTGTLQGLQKEALKSAAEALFKKK